MFFLLLILLILLIIWRISGCPSRSCPTFTNLNKNRAELKVLILFNSFLQTSWTTSWHFLSILDKSGSSKIFLKISKLSRRIDMSCHFLTSRYFLSASLQLLDGVSEASWCILSRLDDSGGGKVIKNQQYVFKNHIKKSQEAVKKQSRNRQISTWSCYVI